MTSDNPDFQPQRTDLSGPFAEQTFLDEDEVQAFDEISEQIDGSLGLALEAFSATGTDLAKVLSDVFEDGLTVDDFEGIEREITALSENHVLDIIDILHILQSDDSDDTARATQLGALIYQQVKQFYEILRIRSSGEMIDPILSGQATLETVIDDVRGIFAVDESERQKHDQKTDNEIVTSTLTHYYTTVLATVIGRAVELCKLPSDPIATYNSVRDALDAYPEDERPIELLVSLLNAQTAVGAYYKSQLFDKNTPDSEAKLYEKTLDEIDLDSLRTFSEIYLRQLDEEQPTARDAKFFADILYNTEKIRFSAARKYYPGCPHCESIQPTPDQYLQSVGSTLEVDIHKPDDDEYDEDFTYVKDYDSVVIYRDMMQLFQTRAAAFIEATKAHIPSEYIGKSRSDTLAKLGKHTLDIAKFAIGAGIAIGAYALIGKKKKRM